MKEIYIGNVIESPTGDKWIVTDVDDTCVSAVSFDSENCSATQKLEDSTYNTSCSCGYESEEGWEHDTECERCHGCGEYDVKVRGWKYSKVLASTVKEFILKGVKKTWNL